MVINQISGDPLSPGFKAKKCYTRGYPFTGRWKTQSHKNCWVESYRRRGRWGVPTRSFSFTQGPEMTMEMSPRRLYIAVIDHEQWHWGRKGLIASVIVGRQGRNLSRAGTWRLKLKQMLQRNLDHLLASPALLSLLSYSSEGHWPRTGNVHSGLGLPTSTTNQDSSPSDLSTCNLTEGVPEVRFPLPR